MSKLIKNRKEIIEKLGINRLNEMQQDAQHTIHAHAETILLSPTGTGKTLAFLLPLISEIDPQKEGVQLLILAPSRELAIQIQDVIREMGTGYKANVFYGGRPISKDKEELKTMPGIVVGTPGRIADHIRRGSIDATTVQLLVLDEFDKALEIGFEEEMEEILTALTNRKKIVLTSATENVEIPAFVGLTKAKKLDYLHLTNEDLTVYVVNSPSKDKLETALATLLHLGNQPGILFCNYKESIHRISTFLTERKIDHGCFYGGMDQQDRERSLIKFRNGTNKLLIATDLAARGIDIEDIAYIIHYHLPLREEEFIHRNGRTARMSKDGMAIVLKWEEEELPEFIDQVPELKPTNKKEWKPSPWKTLFISGGRKDKISKGDIVGLLIKQGKLNPQHIGRIELKTDCAFVAVKESAVGVLIASINNTKLKKKKVRVRLI